MPGSFTTSITSPPQTTQVTLPNGESSGTITGIAFTGGVLSCNQQTQSSITFVFA